MRRSVYWVPAKITASGSTYEQKEELRDKRLQNELMLRGRIILYHPQGYIGPGARDITLMTDPKGNSEFCP